MIREYKTEEQATAIAKEVLYLAWIAAGGPIGMGVFQNKPGATKEDIWNNAYGKGDYPGGRKERGRDVNADYVFGRMLKLNIHRPTPTSIEVPDYPPEYDYQSWCGKYRTYIELFNAAETNVKE